ncbi:hypothetical protein DH2020_044226 [Rehmannia glutinosa]|uniref:Non-haem dioxygenase N-terminal domain-containing protein n=1 Tax=Rehmannia glutinosa TaxID=99300 RepID=A0ABR0UIC1_REHGL
MASSAQQHHHHLPTPYAITAAPPPTPSAQSNHSSDAATSDALSHLLRRLPPTLSLSLPTRHRSSAATTTTPPIICLSDPTPSLHSASTQLGFFQLTRHPISAHLHLAAESVAFSLFSLPHHQKQLLFPTDCWPLGYDSAENDDDDVSAAGESFCLDPSCSTESADGSGLDLGSLRELGREMEKLGLVVMEKLALAIGFDNPARGNPSRVCSQMWISDGKNNPGRIYPYVVGLHYQARFQKYSLLSDSGWVNVSGQVEVDSVLVTLGDVAQVWSNGKLKKVRGRPMPSVEANNNSNSNCITISLLITLPLESTVAPLVPGLAINGTEEEQEDKEGSDSTKKPLEKRLFNSFSFEDYAWRVYHERILLKDPLVRYRV